VPDIGQESDGPLISAAVASMVSRIDPDKSNVRVRASSSTISSPKRQPVSSAAQLITPCRRFTLPSTSAPASRTPATYPGTASAAPSNNAATTMARTRRDSSQRSARTGSSASASPVRRSTRTPRPNASHNRRSAPRRSSTGRPLPAAPTFIGLSCTGRDSPRCANAGAQLKVGQFARGPSSPTRQARKAAISQRRCPWPVLLDISLRRSPA
jgi:hypothetical protein